MSIFNKVKIKDVCEKVASGGTPSRKRAEYFNANEGHLWVKSKELVEKGIADTEEKITEAGLKNSSAKYYPANSVLVAMYGANAGQLAWLKKPATVNQAICALVVDPKKADWRFVYYSLLESRQGLIIQARGGAQPNLNKYMVENFEIPIISDIKTQTRIASVLSAYDDLIENNEKRIKVLEEMAQLLYTEWFVKFKFPGHEKVKMVDSGTEYGKIPEGWVVVKIGERFETVLGGTPSRAKPEFWENGVVPWINSGEVNNLRITEASELITETALEKSATKMMPKRTTVLAITGATLGQVSLTEIECCANQSVIGIFDEDRFLNEYIYLRIKYEIKNIIALAGGGAQQHINKEIVYNKLFLLPNKKTSDKFAEFVRPIFDEVSKLIFNNHNLSKTRDLLIPQLVTGKRELK